MSKSTTEDEVVSLARNMFVEGLRTLHLSEKLLGRRSLCELIKGITRPQ